ncbi:hypothetical protein CANCADRAFT_58236 [Tortispora caseinolytica NRRL Y-17796]|uniref:t-SNARE coiled-coil homology domain-containing protein n=1 Tax=Tortispora caseinolytica NRRL Y-17796 TaxID=767744 RepID=A0A1E4TC19_9ASCO|nr:hypothetical protein CANCADRAFT_58236 [Tortispora caseinolytica NRRL Y-17796]
MSKEAQVTLLADQVATSVNELKRLESLNLQPTDTELEDIHASLDRLRQAVSALDIDGTVSSSALANLQKRYEDIVAQMYGSSLPNDLAASWSERPRKTVRFRPDLEEFAPTQSASPPPNVSKPIPADTSSAVTAGNTSSLTVDTLTPFEPYTDNVDTGFLGADAILLQNRQTMAQQDQDLDTLSASISRQRELGLHIGQELDDHVTMLDDVEALVDRSTQRLSSARKRLDKFSKALKEHGSNLTIAALIVILIVLIIVLK